MKMVEKVARALTEVQIRSANELFKLTNPRRVRSEERIIAAIDSGWRLNEKDARAAIEAMMEPTESMLDAGDAADGYDVYVGVWTAMIQAALKEGQ